MRIGAAWYVAFLWGAAGCVRPVTPSGPLLAAVESGARTPRVSAQQAAAKSARAAAVAFALTHGMAIPREGVVVARETDFGRRLETRIAPGLGESREIAEASEIARLIGPSVDHVAVSEVLTCVRYSCATSGQLAVLLASEPEPVGEDHLVLLSLFLSAEPPGRPQRSLTGAVVRVARGDDGWIGREFRLGPSPVHPVRLPPPG